MFVEICDCCGASIKNPVMVTLSDAENQISEYSMCHICGNTLNDVLNRRMNDIAKIRKIKQYEKADMAAGA